jgi:hypothetical protein
MSGRQREDGWCVGSVHYEDRPRLRYLGHPISSAVKQQSPYQWLPPRVGTVLIGRQQLRWPIVNILSDLLTARDGLPRSAATLKRSDVKAK